MPDALVPQTAGPDVNYEDVVEPLHHFIDHLAMIHGLLFAIPLVVTSGKDKVHAAGSLHSVGRAVDIRTADKDPRAQLMLLSLLCFAADTNAVTIFDERNLPGEPHIHVEWHGQ